jgi:hypothetical protein
MYLSEFMRFLLLMEIFCIGLLGAQVKQSPFNRGTESQKMIEAGTALIKERSLCLRASGLANKTVSLAPLSSWLGNKIHLPRDLLYGIKEGRISLQLHLCTGRDAQFVCGQNDLRRQHNYRERTS